LTATRAGYDGKSRFTVRWTKPPAPMRPHMKAIVFRAMDQTLFLTDWEQQRPPLTLTTSDPAFPTAWLNARKTQIANELATAQALWAPAATFAEAELHYAALSDDAVAVLANLPGNEEAFAQITIDPLSLADPAQDDRLGPDDDAATFPGPNANLNAWLDTLDGRSQNRYLYKVAFIDAAQNRSPLGLSTPPVYLPKVVPPRAPVITKVIGGERQITLQWAANRERDLAGYRVYRTDDDSKAADVRSMDFVHSAAVTEVEWIDEIDLIPGRKYFYRLTATDTFGNESAPTRSYPAIAIDTAIPFAPVWSQPTWLVYRASDGSFAAWPSDNVVSAGYKAVLRLGFSTETPQPEFVLTRLRPGERTWIEARSSEIRRDSIDPQKFLFVDDEVDAEAAITYRLKVRSSSGVWSTDDAILQVLPARLTGGS
jgi:hypothetical protein